jgi:archaeosine-15-forming tRNA-guanine transglycosylase
MPRKRSPLRTGCLVVDAADALVAVGQILLVPGEIADSRKGMAVKVREGVPA